MLDYNAKVVCNQYKCITLPMFNKQINLFLFVNIYYNCYLHYIL